MRVRFYSIGVKRAECNRESVTDAGLLPGRCRSAIHLRDFPEAGAPFPLVNVPEEGRVSLVLRCVPDESVNRRVPGREAARGVHRT